jgi:hypothetical protein
MEGLGENPSFSFHLHESVAIQYMAGLENFGARLLAL